MSLSRRLSRPPSRLNIDLPTNTSTTLYITVTAELRSDCNVYMFGFDKCFTTLEQANARIDLLGRCNVNPKVDEMKLMHIEAETGCFCVTWIRDRYASRPRFLAQVKKMDMLGSVPQQDGSAVSPGGWLKKDSTHFDAAFVLDKKDHVWAVAIHEPAYGVGSNESLMRRASTSMSYGRHERYSYHSSADILRSPSTEHKREMSEQDSGWTVHSIHSSSDHAVAQAKRAWNMYFRDKGRCKKDSQHLAFGRQTLRPALMNERDSGLETCLQIRVERIKVVSKDDHSMDLISKQILEKLKVLMPVPTKAIPERSPGNAISDQKQIHRRGKLANISLDHRSSFMDGLYEIVNRAFKDNFNYGEVALALNIRSDELQRFGLEGQRYGAQVIEAESVADLYHATLRGLDQKKIFPRGKVSESFLRAHKRMNEAAKDLDPPIDSGTSFARQTSSVSSRALTPVSSSILATKTQPNASLKRMEGNDAVQLAKRQRACREAERGHILCERFQDSVMGDGSGLL